MSNDIRSLCRSWREYVGGRGRVPHNVLEVQLRLPGTDNKHCFSTQADPTVRVTDVRDALFQAIDLTYDGVKTPRWGDKMLEVSVTIRGDGTTSTETYYHSYADDEVAKSAFLLLMGET